MKALFVFYDFFLLVTWCSLPVTSLPKSSDNNRYWTYDKWRKSLPRDETVTTKRSPVNATLSLHNNEQQYKEIKIDTSRLYKELLGALNKQQDDVKIETEAERRGKVTAPSIRDFDLNFGGGNVNNNYNKVGQHRQYISPPISLEQSILTPSTVNFDQFSTNAAAENRNTAPIVNAPMVAATPALSAPASAQVAPTPVMAFPPAYNVQSFDAEVVPDGNGGMKILDTKPVHTADPIFSTALSGKASVGHPSHEAVINNPRNTQQLKETKKPTSTETTSKVSTAANANRRVYSLGDHVFTDIGCYLDKWIRAIPTLEGNHPLLMDSDYKSRSDPLQKCAEAALDKGLKVFALQNGGQCFGGTNGESKFNVYGTSAYCKDDGLGGSWANEVYTYNSVPRSSVHGSKINKGAKQVTTTDNLDDFDKRLLKEEAILSESEDKLDNIDNSPFKGQLKKIIKKVNEKKKSDATAAKVVSALFKGIKIKDGKAVPDGASTSTSSESPYRLGRALAHGHKPPCICPDKLCSSKLDLAFVIDAGAGSEQGGKDKMAETMEFGRRVASAFTVTPEETHVGLITYATDAQVMMNFNRFNDPDALIEARDAVRVKPHTGKYTGQALSLAKDGLFEAGHRPDALDVLVLMTDGSASDDVTEPARALRDMGVKIITVGIGQEVDKAQLDDIASDPDEEHVFTADYDNLATIIGRTQRAACVGGTLKDPVAKCKCNAFNSNVDDNTDASLDTETAAFYNVYKSSIEAQTRRANVKYDTILKPSQKYRKSRLIHHGQPLNKRIAIPQINQAYTTGNAEKVQQPYNGNGQSYLQNNLSYIQLQDDDDDIGQRKSLINATGNLPLLNPHPETENVSPIVELQRNKDDPSKESANNQSSSSSTTTDKKVDGKNPLDKKTDSVEYHTMNKETSQDLEMLQKFKPTSSASSSNSEPISNSSAAKIKTKATELEKQKLIQNYLSQNSPVYRKLHHLSDDDNNNKEEQNTDKSYDKEKPAETSSHSSNSNHNSHAEFLEDERFPSTTEGRLHPSDEEQVLGNAKPLRHAGGLHNLPVEVMKETAVGEMGNGYLQNSINKDHDDRYESHDHQVEKFHDSKVNNEKESYGSSSAVEDLGVDNIKMEREESGHEQQTFHGGKTSYSVPESNEENKSSGKKEKDSEDKEKQNKFVFKPKFTSQKYNENKEEEKEDDEKEKNRFNKFPSFKNKNFNFKYKPSSDSSDEPKKKKKPKKLYPEDTNSKLEVVNPSSASSITASNTEPSTAPTESNATASNTEPSTTSSESNAAPSKQHWKNAKEDEEKEDRKQRLEEKRKEKGNEGNAPVPETFSNDQHDSSTSATSDQKLHGDDNSDSSHYHFSDSSKGMSPSQRTSDAEPENEHQYSKSKSSSSTGYGSVHSESLNQMVHDKQGEDIGSAYGQYHQKLPASEGSSYAPSSSQGFHHYQEQEKNEGNSKNHDSENQRWKSKNNEYISSNNNNNNNNNNKNSDEKEEFYHQDKEPFKNMQTLRYSQKEGKLVVVGHKQEFSPNSKENTEQDSKTKYQDKENDKGQSSESNFKQRERHEEKGNKASESSKDEKDEKYESSISNDNSRESTKEHFSAADSTKDNERVSKIKLSDGNKGKTIDLSKGETNDKEFTSSSSHSNQNNNDHNNYGNSNNNKHGSSKYDNEEREETKESEREREVVKEGKSKQQQQQLSEDESSRVSSGGSSGKFSFKNPKENEEENTKGYEGKGGSSNMNTKGQKSRESDKYKEKQEERGRENDEPQQHYQSDKEELSGFKENENRHRNSESSKESNSNSKESKSEEKEGANDHQSQQNIKQTELAGKEESKNEDQKIQEAYRNKDHEIKIRYDPLKGNDNPKFKSLEEEEKDEKRRQEKSEESSSTKFTNKNSGKEKQSYSKENSNDEYERKKDSRREDKEKQRFSEGNDRDDSNVNKDKQNEEYVSKEDEYKSKHDKKNQRFSEEFRNKEDSSSSKRKGKQNFSKEDPSKDLKEREEHEESSKNKFRFSGEDKEEKVQEKARSSNKDEREKERKYSKEREGSNKHDDDDGKLESPATFTKEEDRGKDGNENNSKSKKFSKESDSEKEFSFSKEKSRKESSSNEDTERQHKGKDNSSNDDKEEKVYGNSNNKNEGEKGEKEERFSNKTKERARGQSRNREEEEDNLHFMHENRRLKYDENEHEQPGETYESEWKNVDVENSRFNKVNVEAGESDRHHQHHDPLVSSSSSSSENHQHEQLVESASETEPSYYHRHYSDYGENDENNNSNKYKESSSWHHNKHQYQQGNDAERLQESAVSKNRMHHHGVYTEDDPRDISSHDERNYLHRVHHYDGDSSGEQTNNNLDKFIGKDSIREDGDNANGPSMFTTGKGKNEHDFRDENESAFGDAIELSDFSRHESTRRRHPFDKDNVEEISYHSTATVSNDGGINSHAAKRHQYNGENEAGAPSLNILYEKRTHNRMKGLSYSKERNSPSEFFVKEDTEYLDGRSRHKSENDEEDSHHRSELPRKKSYSYMTDEKDLSEGNVAKHFISRKAPNTKSVLRKKQVKDVRGTKKDETGKGILVDDPYIDSKHFWPFDSSTAILTQDIMTGNKAILMNGAAIIKDDFFDNTASTHANGSYIILGDFNGTCFSDPEKCLLGGMSVSFWMKLSSLNDNEDQYILSSGSQSKKSRGIAFLFFHGEFVVCLSKKNKQWKIKFPKKQIALNKWVNVAFVWKVHDGSFSFYLNGERKETTKGTPVSRPDLKYTIMTAGRPNNAVNSEFMMPFCLSYLALWEAALTEKQVKNMYINVKQKREDSSRRRKRNKLSSATMPSRYSKDFIPRDLVL